ncbi:hypothetical protein EI94DRAFT_1740544, partial [Lactarius quietus]
MPPAFAYPSFGTPILFYLPPLISATCLLMHVLLSTFTVEHFPHRFACANALPHRLAARNAAIDPPTRDAAPHLMRSRPVDGHVVQYGGIHADGCYNC